MFSEWVNELMGKRGMTQADLARKSGLTRGGISLIVQGKTKPTPETIEKLSKALGVSIEEGYRAADLLRPVSERNQLENELLHNFDQLDEDGKQHLLIIVRALADSNAKGRKKNHRGAAEAIS